MRYPDDVNVFKRCYSKIQAWIEADVRTDGHAAVRNYLSLDSGIPRGLGYDVVYCSRNACGSLLFTSVTLLEAGRLS